MLVSLKLPSQPEPLLELETQVPNCLLNNSTRMLNSPCERPTRSLPPSPPPARLKPTPATGPPTRADSTSGPSCRSGPTPQVLPTPLFLSQLPSNPSTNLFGSTFRVFPESELLLSHSRLRLWSTALTSLAWTEL